MKNIIKLFFYLERIMCSYIVMYVNTFSRGGYILLISDVVKQLIQFSDDI